ncbi:MAG: hypothetical protein ABI548_12345 [Polyangiaceae bacterium]
MKRLLWPFATTVALVVALVCALAIGRSLRPPVSALGTLAGSAPVAVSAAATALPPQSSSASDQASMAYLYNGPESPDDHRYDYHWMVLREALERTMPKYGPYRMEAASYMSEDRQAEELRNDSGRLNILIRGDTAEYGKAFAAVWIPIDKGLLGYRVFLTRAELQPQLDAVNSLDGLKPFPIGQGSGWKDIDILRASGLTVTVGADYAGLFAMLANRRFDLFSRGVEEVTDEYAQHRQGFPDLAIERHLLLYYPIARYFWFARSKHSARLAERVREGMIRMVEDGSLDRLFEESHRQLFAQLGLASRKLLILSNPLASPDAPLRDSRLWFRPLAGAERPSVEPSVPAEAR